MLDETISTDVLMKQIKSDEVEAKTHKAARIQGLEYIDLRKYSAIPSVFALIPKKDAMRLSLAPFRSDAGALHVAIQGLTPEVKKYLAALAKSSKLQVIPYLVSDQSLTHILPQYEEQITRQAIAEVNIKRREFRVESLELTKTGLKTLKAFAQAVNRGSTDQQLMTILAASLDFGASDIHMELTAGEAKLRLRVDGLLQEAGSLNLKNFDSLATRLKFYAKMKLNVTEPQDGRIEATYGSEKIDFRVSTIPAVYGENITIRVLKTSAQSLNLQDLGLSHHDFLRLKEMIDRPRGMVLVTGPTGHGKTTTLYAILNVLNEPRIKISTLEDPVEYTLPGAVQSQVDESHGFTYEVGIKALLRQNPDIIMIGEIRDPASGETAFRAALSGHIAFSTYHAGEAVGAIPALIEMGVKPFLAASALSLIIAQRLVRKICPFCSTPVRVSEEVMLEVKSKLSHLPKSEQPKNLTFYRGKGCDNCHGLGYLGQIGIFELMKVTSEITKASISNVPFKEIEMLAESQGMISMEQDGYLKALKGLTTLEEVWRVTGVE